MRLMPCRRQCLPLSHSSIRVARGTFAPICSSFGSRGLVDKELAAGAGDSRLDSWAALYRAEIAGSASATAPPAICHSSDPPRTRAWNLRLRGPTPYPLGQRTYVLGQARGLCSSASSTDVRWHSNASKAMAKPWPARLGFEPGPRARGTSARPLGQPFLKGTETFHHDTKAYSTERA